MTLRESLAAGDFLLGAFLALGSPVAAQAAQWACAVRDRGVATATRAVRRVARAGKPAGLYAVTAAEVALARAEGLRFVAAGSDLTHMLAAARATIAACATTNPR